MDGLSAIVPFLIGGSMVGYLVALTAIGVYSATRREGRSDWFRSDALKLTAVAVVALLGVLPTEVLSIAWLMRLQDHVEVTANLFVLVPAPVVAVMVAVQALVLSRVYRTRPLLFAAVYLGVYALAYAFWLSRLFNPPGDIARYAVVILIVGALVMALFARFVWRRPA